MDKIVIISVDLPKAKQMLRLAGFNVLNKADDEIFNMVLDILTPYSATYKIMNEKEN